MGRGSDSLKMRQRKSQGKKKARDARQKAEHLAAASPSKPARKKKA